MTTCVLQKTTKSGTSRYSFHYCGRAVDINQALGGGKGQWHFQYKPDKQETFLDEMELIGYTEKQLREAGWNTEEMLDHKPG